MRSPSTGRTKGAGGGGGLLGALAFAGRAFSFAGEPPAVPDRALNVEPKRLSTCAYLPTPSASGAHAAAASASACSRRATAAPSSAFICARLSRWWLRVYTGFGGLRRFPMLLPRSMSWLLRIVTLAIFASC